jgi:hypothetical protein
VTALVVVEAVALVLLAVLVAGLLRSHAEILRALHRLGVDVEGGGGLPGELRVELGVARPRATAAPASDVVGTTPGGEALAVGIVDTPHDTLVAFLSSGCITCHGFWDAFRDHASLSLPTRTRLVIATQGPEHESAAKVRALSPPDVPVVMSTTAWEGYGVPGAPYFIHVHGPSGRVLGEGAASTWAQVASLLQQAVDDGPTVSAVADATRESRADRELLAAGITPDHPSLYPPTQT